MTKEEFKILDILKQIEFYNSKTITGLTVGEVAQNINMSESAIRRIFKKNNYVFNRVEKIYSLIGNNEEITKEPKSNKAAIIKETYTSNNKEINKEEKSNNNYLTKEEIKGLKELLAAKEKLLSVAFASGNKTGITIIDISNIDRSNRKKATFNMNIELLNRLETYSSNPNISKSDIVNIAIDKYLKDNKIMKE